jgi:16S rRNA G527 N7-methylase RsmG
MQRTFKLDNTHVIEGRVEDVENIKVDAALTRATFAVEDFVKGAAHIVRDGGVFVMSKGPRVKEELKSATFAYEVMNVSLPMTDIERTFVTVKKA